MTIDEVLSYCLGKPGAWQDQPWEESLVVKVGKKIFVFFGDDRIGVKCAPTREEADEWLARFPDDATVMAYIGRSGWNSLTVGAGIPDDDIFDAIDTSYEFIVSKLPKRDRPQSA